MNEDKLEKEFQELLNTVLTALKSDLEEIEEFPVDFNSDSLHDTIHREVDSWACTLDRKAAISWIDFCGNEDNIDEGVVDRSSLEKTLITMAFECVRQHLFDKCQLFYDMQEYDLTKKKRNAFVKAIDEIVGNFKPKRIDSESQVWVELKFPLEFKDFPDPAFNPHQMIDLHDGIKILASNTAINRNAVVIEKPNDEGLTRIYLMERDKDVDIREFFKIVQKSIKENNYSLKMSDYIGGEAKKKFDNKKEFVWVINQMVCNLLKRK